MKKGYQFSVTGFVIALVVIAMLASTLALFMGTMGSEYGISGNSSLESYNKISNISDDVNTLQEKTTIQPEDGFFDIIGAYFTYGYSALKTSLKSVDVFRVLIQEASMDIPVLGHINLFITTIILVILFIGVIVSVLVKMRI